MKISFFLAASILSAIVFNACGGGSGNHSTLTDEELLDKRPFEMKIPANYDDSNPVR